MKRTVCYIAMVFISLTLMLVSCKEVDDKGGYWTDHQIKEITAHSFSQGWAKGYNYGLNRYQSHDASKDKRVIDSLEYVKYITGVFNKINK